jgi:DNA invertase Pin-like site-specific DNA recombinase
MCIIEAMKYGYARVSPGGTDDSVNAQVRALTKAGCKKVFREIVSGAKTDRAQRLDRSLVTKAALGG